MVFFLISARLGSPLFQFSRHVSATAMLGLSREPELRCLSRRGLVGFGSRLLARWRASRATRRRWVDTCRAPRPGVFAVPTKPHAPKAKASRPRKGGFFFSFLSLSLSLLLLLPSHLRRGEAQARARVPRNGGHLVPQGILVSRIFLSLSLSLAAAGGSNGGLLARSVLGSPPLVFPCFLVHARRFFFFFSDARACCDCWLASLPGWRASRGTCCAASAREETGPAAR